MVLSLIQSVLIGCLVRLSLLFSLYKWKYISESFFRAYEIGWVHVFFFILFLEISSLGVTVFAICIFAKCLFLKYLHMFFFFVV